MMTDRVEDMAAFAAVAQAGGFTAAATRLDVSKSRLSRQVSALEARLGVRLLHRTTRATSLTDAGAAYLAHAMRLLEDMAEAEDAVRSLGGALAGTIRIAAPLTFGIDHVAPAVQRFMAAHPAVLVDASFDDRRVDLVAGGFDLAIRMGPRMADSGLVVRTLADLRTAIVGAPFLLDSVGRPERLDDLAKFPCLVYANRPADDQWRFETADGPRVVRGPERLRADNGTVLAEAAAAGFGLTVLPIFIVGPLICSGRLEIILPGQLLPRVEMRLVHPPGRQRSTKVRALADHLAAAFRGAPWERDVPLLPYP